VVDVVFYAEGNSRVSVANMRHGYFVPLRHAQETEKEKESKSKQVAYCFDIGSGRAKRKSYVGISSRRTCWVHGVVAKARTEINAARLHWRVSGRVCGCWKSNLA